jgi:hypothetical protein
LGIAICDGSEAVPVILWPSEAIEASGKQKELTTKLYAQPIEAGKDQGGLAAYELVGRRCSGRTSACQLTTGGILGEAKASTNIEGDQ